jgi:hypothetical protein
MAKVDTERKDDGRDLRKVTEIHEGLPGYWPHVPGDGEPQLPNKVPSKDQPNKQKPG